MGLSAFNRAREKQALKKAEEEKPKADKEVGKIDKKPKADKD